MNPSMECHIDLHVGLPPRTEEISKQVALGYPKKAVASIFNISVRTVENLVRSAFKRTGAKNIAELTVYFLCREFHATIVISQAKRQIIAVAMILILLPFELLSNRDIVRPARTSRGGAAFCSRASSRSRNEDYILEL